MSSRPTHKINLRIMRMMLFYDPFDDKPPGSPTGAEWSEVQPCA
jgi:hypothetical protein